jgi:hypothetical protein
MVRLQVSLTADEAEALAKWAAEELRDPRDQIRLIVRRELQRRVPSTGTPTQPEPESSRVAG